MKTNNNGNGYYWLGDKLHREDGPAVERPNGTKEWWVNGKRHREDGPAFEGSNGRKQYYIDGKRIKCSSDEEFIRLVKLKMFWQ